MSNFAAAIQITLEREGGYTIEADGEPVNMGLKLSTLRVWGYLGNPPASGPATPKEIAAIKSMSVQGAAQLYKTYVWDKQRCSEIEDQNVAAKYFDLCVNQGWREATMILQRAANDYRRFHSSTPLAIDGIIGPNTVAAVNLCNPVILMFALRAEATDVYRKIAAAHPELQNRLQGWLNRLNS